MFKYSIAIVFFALLTGCGGGSGTGSSAQNEADSNNNGVGSTPSNDSTVGTTSELKTSSDFDFSNNQNLSLDIQLAQFSDERVMVNVCLPQASSPDQVAMDSPAIDYSQCLYKATITHGELQVPLTLAKHNHLLILELRAYSDLSTKTTYQWQPTDGSYWVVR
ncbi:hypothetical protein [Marinomonas mediterranea]|jgi:hypothetical protein|uniref:Lipoprotein n=1 Tax=Marinomonas mediterranea (strain ATCC 700492 / JCM 21426 / NBRC 103028 / MMB-1) TaxID=717774 RepID=F2K213_MARM1|nr:hypothetical protein [Marinomonas mediterranea]ADZ90007.1 hypothetical protein Marme_0724 [Marinomonas mediterranea MMB-1]WCN16215.1 hypothetical protein GV053_03630 [Marinomonas mediterranea MMB-1]